MVLYTLRIRRSMSAYYQEKTFYDNNFYQTNDNLTRTPSPKTNYSELHLYKNLELILQQSESFLDQKTKDAINFILKIRQNNYQDYNSQGLTHECNTILNSLNSDLRSLHNDNNQLKTLKKGLVQILQDQYFY